MNIEEIFISFIASEQLDLADNNSLVKTCLDKIKNDGDYNQSYIKYDEKDNYQDLFPTLQNYIDTLSTHYELNKLQITNAWINLDNGKSITGAHNHSQDVLSGVYYVSAGEGSGNLEFLSPVTASSYVFGNGTRTGMNRLNSDQWTVTPKTGKLIIFPSWLYHYVRINTDTTDRISIAFNASFA
jgi:uncharacterized protein (TIGR02466 family)|tara:strand:- start:79 stop:630 length:552 start_codon:yes stop_codon:yes gene_type:complete